VLGHEVIVERDVDDLVRTQMAEWARKDVAERHVHVLLADVFASYVMGLAYGHASIRLRFNPSRAYIEDCDHPAEASRAQVVLRTLERMPVFGADANWRAEVQALRTTWDEAIAAAMPEGAPPDDPAALDNLVKEALEHFELRLNPPALYSNVKWLEAQRLYQRWRDEAENAAAGAPLGAEPEKLTTPRDVLNAAWLLRLERSDDADRIERAAAAMCRTLLFNRRVPPGSPGLGPIPGS